MHYLLFIFFSVNYCSKIGLKNEEKEIKRRRKIYTETLLSVLQTASELSNKVSIYAIP